MTEPSLRCTLIAGSLDVSMVTLHALLTSDSDRILARMEALLYQNGPRLGKLPITWESWCQPFMMARRTCGPGCSFRSISLLQNTEIVDCESKSFQFGLMALVCDCTITSAYCTRVVPVSTNTVDADVADAGAADAVTVGLATAVPR